MRKFVKLNSMFVGILVLSHSIQAEEVVLPVQEAIIAATNIPESEPQKVSFFITAQKIYRRAALSDAEKQHVQNIKRGILVLGIATAGMSLFVWGDSLYKYIHELWYSNAATKSESESSSDDEEESSQDHVSAHQQDATNSLEQEQKENKDIPAQPEQEEEEEDDYFLGDLFKTLGLAKGKKVKNVQGIGASKTVRNGLKNKHQGSNSKAAGRIVDQEEAKKRVEAMEKQYAMLYKQPEQNKVPDQSSEEQANPIRKPVLPLGSIIEQKYKVLPRGKTGARIKKGEEARQKSMQEAEERSKPLENPMIISAREKDQGDSTATMQGSENW